MRPNGDPALPRTVAPGLHALKSPNHQSTQSSIPITIRLVGPATFEPRRRAAPRNPPVRVNRQRRTTGCRCRACRLPILAGESATPPLQKERPHRSRRRLRLPGRRGAQSILHRNSRGWSSSRFPGTRDDPPGFASARSSMPCWRQFLSMRSCADRGTGRLSCASARRDRRRTLICNEGRAQPARAPAPRSRPRPTRKERCRREVPVTWREAGRCTR